MGSETRDEKFYLLPRPWMNPQQRATCYLKITLIVVVILLLMKHAKLAVAVLVIGLIAIAFAYWEACSVLTNQYKLQAKSRSSKYHDEERVERFSVGAGHSSEDDGGYAVLAKKKANAKGIKHDPRRPYPPTVDQGFVVKAAYGRVLNKDPVYEDVVKPFNAKKPTFTPKYEAEEPDEHLESERARNIKKSYTGGPRVNYKMSTRAARFHGYQTQEFEDFEVGAENEAEEDSDQDSEPDVRIEDQIPSVSLPAPVEQKKVQVKAASQRQFLPCNFDAAFDDETTVTINKADRAKPMISRGRNARVTVSRKDIEDSERKYDGDELFFGRTAKEQKTVRAQQAADRQSTRNTIFSS